MPESNFIMNKINGTQFKIETTKDLAGEEQRLIKEFKNYMDRRDVCFNDIVFLAYPDAMISEQYGIIAFGEDIMVSKMSPQVK